jgi:hypothetical protein
MLLRGVGARRSSKRHCLKPKVACALPVRCLCAACARGAVFTSDPYQAIPYQDIQKNKVMNFHKLIHHHRSIVRMCWQEDNFLI